MKCNAYYREKKEETGSKNQLNSKNLISVDQPFDYKEVVAITGSEYVQNLHYDGVTLMPYEELRRNSAVFDLPEEEVPQMMAGIFDLCCECV